jgi:peroxiredoxin
MKNKYLITLLLITCFIIVHSIPYKEIVLLLPGVEVISGNQLDNNLSYDNIPKMGSCVINKDKGILYRIVSTEDKSIVGYKSVIESSDINSTKIFNESLVPDLKIISSISINPNGDKLAICGLKEFDGTNTKNNNWSSLWILSLNDNKLDRVTQPGFDVISADWSPNGKYIAYSKYIRNNKDNEKTQNSIILIDSQNFTIEKKSIDIEDNYVGNIKFSPDSCSIAFQTDNDSVGTLNLYDKLFKIIFDASTLTMDISKQSTKPTLISFCWLPDCRNLLVSIKAKNKKTDIVYRQLRRVNIYGDVAFIGDGTIWCNSTKSSSIYLWKNGQNLQIDLRTKLTPYGPIDFTLKDINDKQIDIKLYRGDIIVIDVMASWCGYCQNEIGFLNELHTIKINDKKINIIGLSVDWEKYDLQDFVKAQNIHYPIVMAEKSAVLQLGSKIKGLPLKYLIDENGMIFDVISGHTSKDEIEQHIKGYLLEKNK